VQRFVQMVVQTAVHTNSCRDRRKPRRLVRWCKGRSPGAGLGRGWFGGCGEPVGHPVPGL